MRSSRAFVLGSALALCLLAGWSCGNGQSLQELANERQEDTSTEATASPAASQSPAAAASRSPATGASQSPTAAAAAGGASGNTGLCNAIPTNLNVDVNGLPKGLPISSAQGNETIGIEACIAATKGCKTTADCALIVTLIRFASPAEARAAMAKTAAVLRASSLRLGDGGYEIYRDQVGEWAIGFTKGAVGFDLALKSTSTSPSQAEGIAQQVLSRLP